MLGLAKESIVISKEEAKEYVQLKVERLMDEISLKNDELLNLQEELEEEMYKLDALHNGPSDECKCAVRKAPSDEVLTAIAKLLVG